MQFTFGGAGTDGTFAGWVGGATLLSARWVSAALRASASRAWASRAACCATRSRSSAAWHWPMRPKC